MDNHDAYKLITAIIPKGSGLTVVKTLKDEKQIIDIELRTKPDREKSKFMRYSPVGLFIGTISLEIPNKITQKTFQSITDELNDKIDHMELKHWLGLRYYGLNEWYGTRHFEKIPLLNHEQFAYFLKHFDENCRFYYLVDSAPPFVQDSSLLGPLED